MYGFRTEATARNQETWDYSQRIGAKVLIIYSFFSIAVFIASQVLWPAFFDHWFYLRTFLGLALALSGVLVTAIITQSKATKYYEKNIDSWMASNQSFCGSCGTQVQGMTKTCQSCGQPVQPQPKQAQYQQPPPWQQGSHDYTGYTQNAAIDTEGISAADIEHNKANGASAYLFAGLAAMAAAPESRYVRFHCNQALILHVAGLGIMTISGIMASALPPGILQVIILIIHWINYPLYLTFIIMGVINGITGKVKRLPIIGRFRFVKTIKPDKPGFWT